MAQRKCGRVPAYHPSLVGVAYSLHMAAIDPQSFEKLLTQNNSKSISAHSIKFTVYTPSNPLKVPTMFNGPSPLPL